MLEKNLKSAGKMLSSTKNCLKAYAVLFGKQYVNFLDKKLMAPQKVPSTVLYYFFRHLAYYMYGLVFEKILCLVYKPFYLAIYS